MQPNLSLRFAILGAGIMLSAAAYAQPYGAPSPPHWPRAHSGFSTQPAAYYNGQTQAKITGTSSRLIGEVTGNFDASQHWLPDSTVYHYSGGHGGDHEYDTVSSFPLKYDSSTTWRTDATTFGYKLFSRHTQTFNPLNDLVATQVEQQWNGSAWVNSSRILVSYNAANREDTLLWQNYNTTNGTWINNYRIVKTYNANIFVTGSSYDTWTTATSSWQTQGAYQYTRDLNNNLLVEESLQYDGTAMMLKPVYRIVYHYNSANQNTSSIQQNPSGSSWINTDSNSLLLNGSNQLIEDIGYTWNSTAGTWTKSTHALYTYTPGGKVSLALYQSWNTTTGIYTTTDSVSTIYNSNDQKTRFYILHSSGLNNSESHYYYEPYITTGIANQPSSASLEISIYPVPADGLLHVSVRLSKPQPISCAVYDATGKVVCAWQTNAAAADYSRNLSLSGMPAGTYWLRIGTAAGLTAKAFVVSH